MGISVTNAWRLKKGVEFWLYMRRATYRARVGAHEGVGALLAELEDGFNPGSRGWEAFLQREGTPEKAKSAEARYRLEEEFKKQYESPMRNRFDVAVDLTFVKESKTGAIIFRASAGDAVHKAFDFLLLDKQVVSFNFWTQSDRPKRIPEKEWDRRRAFWNEWDRRLDRVTCHVVAPWNLGRLLAHCDRLAEEVPDEA